MDQSWTVFVLGTSDYDRNPIDEDYRRLAYIESLQDEFYKVVIL